MLMKRSVAALLSKKRNDGKIIYRFISDGIKTPLYNLHVKNGGKMVDFCGFALPVQYADMSVSNSHIHTRKSSSIFDVSHMLQTRVRGKDCLEWFETMCPIDLKGIQNGGSSLTVFLTEKGGIIDDLIVTKIDSENLYIVSNAGCIDNDKAHMLETSEQFRKRNKDVNVEFHSVADRGLIALQGPKSAENLQKLVNDDLSKMYFMTSKECQVAGVSARVTRCGYTGEDGFEISLPADKIENVTEALLNNSDIKLAGLGARDSLRLEAGLCLYGTDIDRSVTPVEANLTWLIAKRRRAEANFPGSSLILRQIKDGVEQRRVGIRLDKGPPARKDAVIKSAGTFNIIGHVTSGCPSPSLGGNVAMGYIKESFKKVGTKIVINVRGKNIEASVAKMPFVPSQYYVKK